MIEIRICLWAYTGYRFIGLLTMAVHDPMPVLAILPIVGLLATIFAIDMVAGPIETVESEHWVSYLPGTTERDT